MALYEHVFICRQDISQQQVEELTEQFTAILGDNGGRVAKTEYWGLRNLAYRVKKNRKGHYSLLNINAPHTAVAEMERQMGLNDDVLRFLTLRVDEHDMEDSPPLQNKGRDRDDRRDRRHTAGEAAQLEDEADEVIDDMDAPPIEDVPEDMSEKLLEDTSENTNEGETEE